ncbi:MAG: 50S ribosomal protein L24 [Acidimicrobiales bacterium]
MRLRKGDRVVVRSGKHRGQRAEVVQTLPAADKVILDGLNVAKRHSKPRRSTMQGGIIDKFMPVAASSVSVWCGSHGGPARIGMHLDDQGRKIRVCKKCGAEL